MVERCLWAGAPGRTGNLHVSGSAYRVDENTEYGRAAVCGSCGQFIGCFVDGKWYDILRGTRGRIIYQEAPFARFGEQQAARESDSAPVVGKKVRV